ncbi:hypothetical protein [Pseudobacter ginsenosidimutans]|uniref:Uncharacterized protein n=1 Tax=Pseudobacter ginsenosidimutans TaxID=661488 RepID=A0A4V2F0Y0_9BACT|nr:hypothetical protein [Pseudobacter ginsenosidimutans]QEC41516.1 hypothetical protein FSB84_07330 [Pseudobacter ginsenosidimutans]RZS71701.1 hypothetical protein EV199_3609 [Pseudobacter ginsenosidimutans]
MKRITTALAALAFMLCFVPISMAQSADCEEIKKENEYLKKALNILTPVKTATSKKMDFLLTKCEGNIKEQTVTITLVVTNHGPNTELNFRKTTGVDVEANEYETYRIKIGSGGSSNKVFTDVPVKTVFQYEKVLPSIKLMKLIALEFGGNDPGFEYKDIPITWK